MRVPADHHTLVITLGRAVCGECGVDLPDGEGTVQYDLGGTRRDVCQACVCSGCARHPVIDSDQRTDAADDRYDRDTLDAA